MRKRAAGACACGMAFGCLIATVAIAQTQMQDWQLRRFLNFRTECQMDDFVDKSPPTGPGRFHAICRNITFYPDGLDLECPDRIDEWTCRIMTPPQEFKGLDILRQDQSKPK